MKAFALPRSTSLLVLALAAAALSYSSCAASWTFESDTEGWRARGGSVLVRRQVETGANPASHGCLSVKGRMPDGWNYASSERVQIQGGALYRLSAWLRVDKLGADSPTPFLKCEFVGPKEKPYLGQTSTSVYDLAKIGAWQRLESEFRVPEAAQECWLALEKGTSNPAELEALLDDVTLEPIPALSALVKYRLEPLPGSLKKVRGVHPRLYLNATCVAELRAAIQTTHAAQWNRLREQAARLARNGPPTYREDDASSGEEQLWQREVGNAMPALALAWVLSGDRQYLDAARQWALASCGYKTWGLGRIDGMDLAAGHQLFGLALVYDWCYSELDEASRRTIRETLVRRAGSMYEAAATGKVWWYRSYLQNHLWVNICGLAAAGFALFDEVEDANGWIGLSLDKFQQTMSALGPDGASHEGVGYWEYGVEYMLKFMDLADALLGVNLYERPWWRQTALYAQHLSLPRQAWTRSNCIVDLADCPRSHWYGPDYLLRDLAHVFRDGHAQWLAEQVEKANVPATGAAWLNLLWFDPAITTQPPTDLPTLRHFNDVEIVSARSDWSGNEALLVFKCGPFLGHRAMGEFSYDPGGGHVHPDVNHFVLFADGEWMIRDDGYRAKWTGQHNTLLVDGQGQLGEGQMWFDGTQALRAKSQPRIVLAESSPALDRIVGDATEAYPRTLGLRRYVRHLLFLKPDILIVGDEIIVDQPRALELRFHPEHRLTGRDGGALLFETERSILRLELLKPLTGKVDVGNVPAADRHGQLGQEMFTVRLRTQARQWRNLTALSWCRAGERPMKVTAETEGDLWHLSAGGRTADLDWSKGQ